MDERIFEVEIRTVVYVVAADEQDAERVVKQQYDTVLANEKDHFTVWTAGEAKSLAQVEGAWRDSRPYLDPDREPFVEMTVKQIFEQ